jgi:hypothetical protein
MSGDPELAAMAAVLQVLQPLDPPMQGRVIRWVLEKLEIGDHLPIGASRGAQGSLQQDQGVPVAASASSAFRVPALALAWTRQNGITDPELECTFHQTGEGFSVIARHVPGSSRRERVLNCYLLAGACTLLSTGEANFTDQKARELCEEYGCLDTTNHSKYLGEKSNDFVGSKSKGWSLTAPGKKRVALLIKEIASSSA